MLYMPIKEGCKYRIECYKRYAYIIEVEINNVIACQDIKELNDTLKELKLIISLGQGVEV
jgi:hypothetical protein